MSADRKALRADLRAAIEWAQSGYLPLADAPLISAWSQNIDAASLPVIGVALPTEDREVVSMDAVQLAFAAVVVIKRAEEIGDDGTALEDALDDDAESLVQLIEADLMRRGRAVELRSSAIDISGAGSPRIGTLTLRFDAAVMRGRTLAT